jgi:hypothetical protein
LDLIPYFRSLDEETRLRLSLNDQLTTSLSATAALQRELDDLRLALKTSENKGIFLQAELTKSLDANSNAQADLAASAAKQAALESELLQLRAAVADKLPLADRVLQMEKESAALVLSMQEEKAAHVLSMQEEKAAHDADLSSFAKVTTNLEAQVASLTSEKMVLLQTLEQEAQKATLSLQSAKDEADDRYNRTFKTKEEYIVQVEAAESALEQTRQQMLQLQMTCNDMRSRIEEAKQNEPQRTLAALGTARKQVYQFLQYV